MFYLNCGGMSLFGKYFFTVILMYEFELLTHVGQLTHNHNHDAIFYLLF